jgi:hypothetical protein
MDITDNKMIHNSRVMPILILLGLLTYSQLACSQTPDYIDGKVLNSLTREPVSFATVRLKSNQLGIYANANGDFKISNNPEFQNDSVIISCIGFKQYSVAFKELKTNLVNKIILKPLVYGLGEVKVKGSRKNLSSSTIISRAILNIKKNYPQNAFSYIAYYRDYQKKEENYINLNEAIIQTLDKGFPSQSISNRYRLLDFRKNMEFPRMNISPYYDPSDISYENSLNKNIPEADLGDQNGNELFVLMVHDALRNFDARSFSYIETFSKDFLYYHDFSEPSKVLNDNLELYKITFSGKARMTGNQYLISGAIYIQPKDYSIHKIAYTCSYQQNGKETKRMFNVEIEYGYEKYIGSPMHLKYVSFNNIFNVIDTTDKSYFRIGKIDWGQGSLNVLNPKGPNVLLPSIFIWFNHNVDPVSAARKENYTVLLKSHGKDISAKIDEIKVVSDAIIQIKLKEPKNIWNMRDSCTVNIKNVKDIHGNILNKRKTIELYQYRELFVQEYNKTLPFTDSCYMQYLPLEQNCVSKYSGNPVYWMNTPENIKNEIPTHQIPVP